MDLIQAITLMIIGIFCFLRISSLKTYEILQTLDNRQNNYSQQDFFQDILENNYSSLEKNLNVFEKPL